MADASSDQMVLARFHTAEGEAVGPQLALPVGITAEQLQNLLNEHVLKNVRSVMPVHGHALFLAKWPNQRALREFGLPKYGPTKKNRRRA
jgi:hypothetical protein